MKPLNKNMDTDCGIVVARFQVPELHEAHIDLIQTVVDNHSRVIIFLGLSPLKATVNNPLDYKARAQMIRNVFPDIDVFFIKDIQSDIDWSGNLDYQIGDLIGPQQTVTLYGSRDSFIKHYTGRFNTQELVSETPVSGKEIRRQVANAHKDSPDFRAGVIWATMNQYPAVLPTVDIAIVDKSAKPAALLLGKKKNEQKYRFVGGFVDPFNDKSFEDSARREVREETGVDTGDLVHLGSTMVDDWRYRAEQNKIITNFYMATYNFGKAEAADDIEKIAWVNINNLHEDLFVDEHKPLFQIFLDKGMKVLQK